MTDNRAKESGSSDTPSGPGNGLEERDLSISLFQANIYGLLLLVPVALLAAVHLLIWRDFSFGITVFEFSPEVASVTFQTWSVLALLVAIVAGIVVHELLHAISWISLGRKPWSAIRFGIVWKALAPYAHLTEPIEVRAYRWGVAMPGLVLGIAPYLVGLTTGVGQVVLFGLIFTAAAAGDALILWVIRSVEVGESVEDHPSRVGCYVIGSSEG